MASLNRIWPITLAAALGVRRHAVTLVAGASSRMKIVDVPDADPGVLDHLLGL